MAQPFVFVRTYPDGFSAENIQLLMREVLPPAQDLTSKPLPHIAFGLGSSGRAFVGYEVELPGLPLSFSIHAEQFLVAHLILNNETKLDALAISSDGYSYHAPCGHCCQFLQEIHKASEIKIFTGPNEQHVPLGRCLPQWYSHHNAIQEHDPDVLQPRNNGLTLIDISPQQQNRYLDIRGVALAAANRSYAPYTNAPSGVVLRDCYGNMLSGSFMESVASNPSLGPVQAALINYVTLTGGRQFEKIDQVVLVETRSGFSQVDTAKIIMKKIAPASSFDVFHCSHPVDSGLTTGLHLGHCVLSLKLSQTHRLEFTLQQRSLNFTIKIDGLSPMPGLISRSIFMFFSLQLPLDSYGMDQRRDSKAELLILVVRSQ